MYWSFTPDFPVDDGVYTEIRRETVQLTDLFDYKFDQNKDDDPTNDYLPYKPTGWYDDSWAELYNQDWVDSYGFEPTIQWIADYIGWDGVSDINVYADMVLREIKVTYEAGGYEDENYIELVQYIPWNVTPYIEGLKWSGRVLLSETDDWGDELDSTITCGDILTDMIFDPLADEMTIYLDWMPINYEVEFVFPNGSSTILGLNYADVIGFPAINMAGDYPGYAFVGWFTEPNGGGEQIPDGYRLSLIHI